MGIQAQEAPEKEAGLIRRTTRCIQGIIDKGKTDLYVSGYYWHLPFAYPPDKRATFNDLAWGLGLGRSLVDEKDNERFVYIQVSRSSHFKPQYAIGYGWQARWNAPFGIKLGAGYAAFVFARSDVYHYTPIPGIVPVASLATGRASLYVAYLPGIHNGITGRGNVLYVFSRWTFK
jgi:palmitoyl transferase